MQLYPFTFNTIFKEKLWGGQKINTVLGKDFSPAANCGETWELSGVPGDVSVVKNGSLKGKNLQELLDEFKEQLVGKANHEKYGNEFPLLIKFIDANQDLSIQVHPGDELARERHNSFGKTEMWYIIQADEGASLISGFSQEVTPDAYESLVNANRLTEVLNREEVQADDVFFIPAGRVHTIGKGCFLAEIQQSSDVTYRIYDFDRKDANGNKRELHTEQAKAAIDYKVYPSYKTAWEHTPEKVNTLVESPFFTTNVLEFSQTTERDYSGTDSFVILIGIDGEAELNYADGEPIYIKKGDAVLIPACLEKIELKTTAGFKLLETLA